MYAVGHGAGGCIVDVEVTGGSIEGGKKCVAILCPFVDRCIIICDIIVLFYPRVLPPLLSGSLPLVRSDLPMVRNYYIQTYNARMVGGLVDRTVSRMGEVG
jgi:hypothetical protein